MGEKSKNYVLTEDKIINESELKKLLATISPYMEQAKREIKNIYFINDYYMIELASLTGLRVNEVCTLKFQDIHDNTISIIGKGNRKRSIILGKRGKSLLKEYKDALTTFKRQSESNSLVFLNHRNKPYTRFSVNKRFHFWVEQARIRKCLTFHSLRHRLASYLLDKNFSLADTRDMLGHACISTTSRYLHFSQKKKDQIYSVL